MVWLVWFCTLGIVGLVWKVCLVGMVWLVWLGRLGIVGLFASIMGVGGAFLMVPAMIYLIGMPTKLVPGTSLFVTIFVTGFVVASHAFAYNTIDLVLVLILITGSIAGVHAGQKMGQKLLTIELQEKIETIPESLKDYNLTITNEGQALCFAYNSQAESTGITTLLQEVKNSGLKLKDLKSDQTSLENIFEQLLKESA